ncbi:MAG: MBL fold metallo-hydrolase [Actinobacteria bacterium]|nr:MBL fold metallo-hydrolase [Actinomycetota bacterium]
MLASGSSGNSIYLNSGETEILVDSGLSARELNRRLSGIGKSLDSIDTVLITHEHNDHIRSARSISSRYGKRLFMSHGTASASGFSTRTTDGKVNSFRTGDSFSVGCLEITSFPVPHDAAEPVGFTISDGSAHIGIATDLGCISLEVLSGLTGCDAVILESNHDATMLKEGPYPPFLKKRVSGPTGHLSNEDAGELLRAIVHEGLKHIVLAHLSEKNNRVELSLECASGALGTDGSRISLSVGFQGESGALIVL